jgi:hypothetical protein
MPPTGRSMETRIAPRMMLTAEAAVNLCRESGRSIWVRLPIYEGTFHIYPGDVRNSTQTKREEKHERT